METKYFQKIFPQLEAEKDYWEIWNQVEVLNITTNPEQTRIRIFTRSEHLIDYHVIKATERFLCSKLFPERNITVKLFCQFVLSGQYTARNLFDVYGESIFEELNDISVLEYNLLRSAEITFTDESHMELAMENNVIAQLRSGEIVAFLEKIFRDRCGLDFTVTLSYQDVKENSNAKDNERVLRQKIREIMARNMMIDMGVEPAEKPEASEGEKFFVAPNESKMNKKGQIIPISDGKPAKKNEKTEKKGDFRKKLKSYTQKPLNPDVIYGKDFEQEPMPLDQLTDPIGEVVVHGKLTHMEIRDIKNHDKLIVILTITDFTDSVCTKFFIPNERREPFDALAAAMENAEGGIFLKVKGMAGIDAYDGELTICPVIGIKKDVDFVVPRMDNSPRKRVELHCHTKMSDMDGVSDVTDIIKCAIKWGHSAIAITDHGNIQAFPVANSCLKKLREAQKKKDEKKGKDAPKSEELKKIENFKLIYGVEAYLVDDLKEIVVDSAGQPLDGTFVVFDLETTGLSPEKNRIIEIGACKVCGGRIIDRFSTFVNPEIPIPYETTQLTSIKDEMVMDAPVLKDILPEFMKFCEGAVMVAHNADFDMNTIRIKCESLGIPCHFTVIDTVMLSRVLLTNLNKYTLDSVAKELKVSLEHHHRAVDDAECTAEIFQKLCERLQEQGIRNLDECNELAKLSDEAIKKLPSHHAIILATCDQGRSNLYHLITLSHLRYFYRGKPRIPKSEFLKYRDGLLIGSACEAGELIQALLSSKADEEIARLVNFYDYLEIQPIGNNMFMIQEEKIQAIKSEEDLRDLNRKVVKLGEEFGKPVVATCDVHFLHPEDEVYRRIIMASQKFKDADEQAPLYLHTTEEMLEEFSYLGTKKAEEVVIENPNKIVDMCERISPVRPDKCPPIIENSDQMLRDICHNRAHKMYGDPLPKEVSERLERELNSIISNGYAVMYIIAQKLVWKSNEDGYLVGSRGSVGSSFVATMSGITEVNPLHAHYLCENCKYSDFDSDLVKSYAGRSGCDLPDQNCPNCGKPLSKLGFDIPFETFLGFEGDKEPDIDLNFSGEYQSKAHKYTEVIFGEGQTYKAGTIGKLAEKTAYGAVKKYYEEHGIAKRKCEIDRIAAGCVDIRRTTGQHPGGIIVLPVGEDIDTFTPVQHPANDMDKADIITTHFDYHSIDHNLLKLDILGHDDPTMIRMLQDLTGVDPTTIPLDDKTVMSLFQNTSALGITPEDIGGCTLGALGIPEFGTDFAMGMLIDTKPQEFSDLIRIAGLSHGTDVWLGNAKDLILSGQATISTAICTRDDIMTYLISMGLESEKSFKIMEAVRKGTVAKGKCDKWGEWKEDMLAHNVPEWYVQSCEKIQYMFPKAHAAAYVMMAWRIAYCKVFYPLAYYAAFFSIRATAFSYELMCMGKEKLESCMRDFEYRKKQAEKDKSKALSNKEEDTYHDMRIVQEMYARGFGFLPIDLYRAQPHNFQIIDGKLMPSFNSIEGLGDNVAISIAEAAKGGPFLSKEDFKERTTATQTNIDKLVELGILSDIPESNQLSLFDFASEKRATS